MASQSACMPPQIPALANAVPNLLMTFPSHADWSVGSPFNATFA